MMTCCTLFAALSLLLAAAPQEPQKAPAGDFAVAGAKVWTMAG